MNPSMMRSVSVWQSSRVPELRGSRHQRTLLPRLTTALLTTGTLLAVSEASALAAPTEISWADFTATHRECETRCTDTEWVEVYYCSTDGYCGYHLELVCVATANVCQSVRTQLPDGDLIDVSIEHDATDPSGIEFRLALGPGITWWKQIMANGWTVWNWDDGMHCNWPEPATPNCDTNSEWTGVLLAGEFTFSKAKFLGAHTDVYVLRDLASRLRGGDRVTFTWIKD